MYTAITGHRPSKLIDVDYVKARLLDAFDIVGTTFLYEGQAEGTDIIAAELAYKHGVPYAACRPWTKHTASLVWKRRYDLAMRYATEVINTSDADYYVGPWMYHDRNHYMVDNADVVIAVWDGSSGGSKATVEYAVANNKKVWRINPMTREVGRYDGKR